MLFMYTLILTSKDGVSSLALALYEGHSAVALLLIHRGADINLPAKVVLTVMCDVASVIDDNIICTHVYSEWLESLDKSQ